MLAYEDVFRSVEDVLDTFPKNWSKNYYENKKSLLIKKFDSENKFNVMEGNYDDANNVITIHNMKALSHELIHMSFENRNKPKNLSYEIRNGLLLGKGKNTIGRSLTEGFCEYVNRKNKCSHLDGQEINHFFSSLLINIYGEEILAYAFYNDPIGFFSDKRFKNIVEISNTLDIIYSTFTPTIGLLGMFANSNVKTNNQILKNKEITSLIGNVVTEGIEIFLNGNIKLFKLIIDEYNNCSNPLVSRDAFATILRSYKTDTYGAFISKDLDEEISAIISEFLNTKNIKKETSQ